LSKVFMLDTNMLTYICSGRSVEARKHLRKLAKDNEICISAITEGEIRFGMAKKKLGQAKRDSIERVLTALEVLPWDSEVAQIYGDFRANLESTGKKLGAYDEQIAAHAMAVGAILVTADRGFREVGDLKNTVNWATDLTP
jgi:tRNA(fMet)-specific endonuclease VapC